jgi:hypothetical protein
MIAKDILNENGVSMIKIDKVWHLQKNGKTIVRPDNPKFCYQLLIDEFGITEPRLKDFK